MKLKQRLATWRPVKPRKRVMIAGILATCLLLCGFTWTWFIEFTVRVLFPFEDAVDTDMILQFDNYVNVDDLQIYLTEPVIAEQVMAGLQSNLSANVYSNVELPEMREESPGKRIIQIIFDRLLK